MRLLRIAKTCWDSTEPFLLRSPCLACYLPICEKRIDCVVYGIILFWTNKDNLDVISVANYILLYYTIATVSVSVTQSYLIIFNQAIVLYSFYLEHFFSIFFLIYCFCYWRIAKKWKKQSAVYRCIRLCGGTALCTTPFSFRSSTRRKSTGTQMSVMNSVQMKNITKKYMFESRK